ncbi:MAG: pitrilysin family protein [Kofleriaceae bacterium]|nr:pitrilysin family protein [Kofleriaceae bacterium]
MSLRAVLLVSLITACRAPAARPVVPVAPPVTAVEPPLAKPAAPAPVPRATKVREVEGITEYTLPNGLQVLLVPDPTQSSVTVNVTYLVGSRHEGYGETGMAHLLEHMLFKGTAKYRNVLKLLDERGAQSNGSTWTDRTNYYETLAGTPENLTFALELEADRMINALISPDDLKTEFSVVRNELEMGENEPLAVLEQRIVSAAYLWHNYGKDTIGSRSDIERVPVPALRAFYEKYYQPDNAVLIVAGKFDEANALASIERTFGPIPKPTRVLPPTYSVEPVQDGERSVTVRRNGDIYAVGVAYHTVGAASPDYTAVAAALDLLDREPSGRLYKKLVETELAASVNASQTMFRDPYLATVMVEIRDAKNVAKVEQILTSEIEKLGSSKIDEREVERWRAGATKVLDLAFTDSQELAVELSEFAALGDWRSLFAYRNQIEKVTTADVQRVAKAYFKQSNRTSGRFIPTKDADRAPHTETPDIAAAVKGIESGTPKDVGEVFVATLENIEGRTTRKTLANGIKAALLPKKTRGGKVQLRLALHWGDEKSLQGKQTIAELTAAMLSRGTTKKSYQDLMDLENQLKSRISIYGDATGAVLELETLRDKLPGALDLAAEMLTSPSFPAKQLELLKQESLASLEQQLQEPSHVAWVALDQLVSPWPKTDPRFARSVPDEIDATKRVTLADIKAFYRDFAGANHAELVVVGDFEAATLTAQVEKLFGSWTSKRPYARLVDKPFHAAPTAKSIDIKDKEMTQLYAAHDVAMKDTDPDYAAWLMVGHLLGGDNSSRIWMRLREKEGLSYGTYAWTSAGSMDDGGAFGASVIVAPQNLAKAKAALLEEITKLLAGPIAADELQRGKDSWLKSQDTSLSSDGYVTSMLAGQAYRDRTMQFPIELRKRIQALTPADVERVAKKYLQPSKLIVVDAGDISKAK